jgi:hypothetical protein
MVYFFIASRMIEVYESGSSNDGALDAENIVAAVENRRFTFKINNRTKANEFYSSEAMFR